VIHQFPRPVPEANAAPTLLIEAARCWRDARDTGELSLPSLSAMLAAHDGAMLAPVLDSLCLFYEAALGRPMAVGEALALSEDEHLLLALLDGSEPGRCLDCPEGTASAFACALCSTRIMLALNLDQRAAPTVQ
jgi:hypothetical protein